MTTKLEKKLRQKTPLIKLFDRTERIIGKGLLLASTPILVPADTIATSIIEKRNPIKTFDKVSNEIKKRLNKGEGRGRHFLGANL